MKEKGISTLVLVFIIASILAMVVFVFHPISLLAARRANQLRYSQTAFFAAEGALYETIQHLRDDPDWPSSLPYEDPHPYMIGEAEIKRTLSEGDEGEIVIDITATIKGRKRRVVGTFARSIGGRMPLDIMLVIDRSGSMAGNPITQAKNAASIFVNIIEQDAIDNSIEHKIGLASYSDSLRLDQTLTEEYYLVKGSTGISGLNAGGYTNIGGGLAEAIEDLDLHSNNPIKVIVILSDGVANRAGRPTNTNCDSCPSSSTTCTQYAIDQANHARYDPPLPDEPRNYIIFSILLNNISGAACRTQGRLTLLRVSNEDPGEPLPPEGQSLTYYKETDDESELTNIFSEIAHGITSPEFFEYQEKLPEPD